MARCLLHCVTSRGPHGEEGPDQLLAIGDAEKAEVAYGAAQVLSAPNISWSSQTRTPTYKMSRDELSDQR